MQCLAAEVRRLSISNLPLPIIASYCKVPIGKKRNLCALLNSKRRRFCQNLTILSLNKYLHHAALRGICSIRQQMRALTRPPKPFASRQQNLAFWTKETSAFWYLIMFKMESYITPIILSYVEKYVKDVKAERSQVRFSFKYFFEVTWKYLVESVERIAIQEVQ